MPESIQTEFQVPAGDAFFLLYEAPDRNCPAQLRRSYRTAAAYENAAKAKKDAEGNVSK